ncbi:hypothetical protein ACHAW5_009602, partial [Stephanodiscus triporus]
QSLASSSNIAARGGGSVFPSSFGQKK